MKKWLMFLLLFILSVLFGCGSGVENSGTLSMSPPVESNGVVNVQAIYTPPSGKTALPGQEIQFQWYYITQSTQSTSVTTTVTGYTNDGGIASSTYTLPTPRTEPFIVYVTSSTGSLTNKEGKLSVQVAL